VDTQHTDAPDFQQAARQTIVRATRLGGLVSEFLSGEKIPEKNGNTFQDVEGGELIKMPASKAAGRRLNREAYVPGKGRVSARPGWVGENRT